MKNRIKILAELTKIRITIFVTVTTALGYIAAKQEIDINFLPVIIGILFLACGAAVINHIQEKDSDALMDRTKNRPLPSGRVSISEAIALAVILVLSGSAILFVFSGQMAAGLALLNLIWYNAVYTPLKKISAFAIIPGSLVGAIPPVVGWVAAGGGIFDPQIIIISSFFFIWQIPHFWLLLLVLDKDYKQAGYPTLTELFSNDQLIRVTTVWIIATAVTGVMIPLFGIIKLPAVNIALFVSGVWLCWKSLKLLWKTENKFMFRFAFRDINLFALSVIILISIDKLII